MSIYNRYGMPNAGYAQPADTNPIDAGVQSVRNAPRPYAHRPMAPPAPNSPVSRDGSVNLGATAPAPMPMDQPIGDITGAFAPHGATAYPTGGTTSAPHVPAPQAPPEALGLINQLQGTLPPTSQSINPILSALQAKGYDAKRATHAGNLPSDDKITVNGSMYDLINDVGGPGASWGANFVDPNPPPTADKSALSNALMGSSYGNQTTQNILQSLATKFALR